MKLELIEKNKDASEITFLYSGVTPAYMNMQRRMILEAVPTLAVEEVIFKKNSSILYDEILAHRIGLLPLVTDLKSYVVREECQCEGEGCAQCTVKGTLKKEGPCIVYSGDLTFEDPAIKSVYDNIPIVKLLEGQELEIQATAELGRGITHVKWAPGHAYFRNNPVIKITKDVEDPKMIEDVCPKKVFKIKSGKLVVEHERDCNLCGACTDKTDAIKLNESNDEFIFTIETWKQLQIKEILTRVFDELNVSLDEFSTQLKEF